MNYSEEQAKHGPKVGELVTITRIAADGERGWDNAWARSMDRNVGKRARVHEVGGGDGIVCINVDDDGEDYFYPYFVLEMVRLPMVGDRVTLVRPSTTEEDWWEKNSDYGWTPSMNEAVGGTYTVTRTKGVSARLDGMDSLACWDCMFPLSCLFVLNDAPSSAIFPTGDFHQTLHRGISKAVKEVLADL
jgi:hypothetical protein